MDSMEKRWREMDEEALEEFEEYFRWNADRPRPATETNHQFLWLRAN
jgi:hypothetical protein